MNASKRLLCVACLGVAFMMLAAPAAVAVEGGFPAPTIPGGSAPSPTEPVAEPATPAAPTKLGGVLPGFTSGFNALPVGGPDRFGYRYIDDRAPGGPVFNWLTPRNLTPVVSGDDVLSGLVNLGFVTTFYGAPYSQIRVCTNGYVVFGSPAGVFCPFVTSIIPLNDSADQMVAGQWVDLFPIGGSFGTVTFDVFSTLRGQVAVITWNNVIDFTGTRRSTFQIHIYASGVFEVHYLSAPIFNGFGGPSVAGIEAPNGWTGIQYFRATSGALTRHAVRYFR